MKAKTRNLINLYKTMLHHWVYLLVGIIFMLGYALFSGISITAVIPLFDFVFKAPKGEVVYKTTSEFLRVIKPVLVKIVSNLDDLLFHSATDQINIYLDNLKDILNATDPFLLLKLICAVIAVLILLKNIFFYGNRVLFANLRGKTIFDVRNQIYNKYLKLSVSFFDKNKVGDSIVRIVSDVKILSDSYIRSIIKIFRDIVLLFVYARIAILLNSNLFFYSLIILPVFGIFVNLLGKKLKKYSRRIQNQYSTLFSNIEEVLNGMPIVHVFSKEQRERRKFWGLNKTYFRYWRKSVLYNQLNVPISEFNSLFIVIVVLILGGSLVLQPNSSFTLGMFTAFLLAIASMLHPIKTITKAYAGIKKASASLERISFIMEKTPAIETAPNPVRKKEFEDKIIYKNAYFGYNEEYVLEDINFEINKGEKVAIVGGSGAGKTTLVNLLPRFYDVSSGKIIIDGVNLNKIVLKDLRDLFGMVTQEAILFNDTLANNIAYGTNAEISLAEIKKAAEIAYADEFIRELPNGYSDVINPKATNFSGGQKQRICIARAIVGNPPIMIFDEATSALDTESERKVQKAMNVATKNRTVVVIAHRLSTVLSSDKIIVLDKGRIIGVGSNKELLETCPKYKKLYKMQFDVPGNI